MHVGNDVVDLRDPSNQPDAIHPRFDVRAFTASELRELRGSASPHRRRWTLWAAKESTYKAAKKLDPTVRFFPREFVVEGLDEEGAEVHHSAGRFIVRLRHCDEWVHAVAATPRSRLGRRRSVITRSPWPGSAEVRSIERARGNPSEVARDLAMDSIASGMAVARKDVELEARGRIPEVRMRDAQLRVDLSLSHDGQYVAWAWAGTRHP